MNFRFLYVVAILISLIVIGACGNRQTACRTGLNCNPTGSNPPSPTTLAFLYYQGSSNDILGASLNSSGTFAALNPYTPATVPSSSLNSMAIAGGRFLYIPENGFSDVQAFSINRTSGALTSIAGSPFGAQAADNTVTIDPSGRFLFVGGQLSPAISVYQINSSTGGLTVVPGSPFHSFNLVFANSLAIDGAGKFLYVGQSFSSNPVVAFSIDQTTGALTEIAGSPFAVGASVLAADPSGKFLIGIADSTGNTGDKHINVYSINSVTGAIVPVSGSPFATTNIPFAIAVHPSGQFVYISVVDDTGEINNLEGYSLNTTTGSLTRLPSSPFINVPVVGECQFEQGGRFAFCHDANGFSVLNVDLTTGSLTHTVPDLSAQTSVPFAATN